jgi:hypothetical protein
MLREISIARRTEGPYQKRWYEDEHGDLFVWLDCDDRVARFQLAYDKPGVERVVEWRRGRGFSHMRVDDSRAGAYHPGSPLLRPEGELPARRVASDFQKRALGAMDPFIAAFVLRKLYAFPESRWQRTLRIGAFIAALLVIGRLLR